LLTTFSQFVVDGNWTTDHTATSERDSSGNVNNVLRPEHFLSSAAPGASYVDTLVPRNADADCRYSTTAMAGQVPTRSNEHSDLPGSFPETPAFEKQDTMGSSTGNSEQTFGVAPIPATSGAGNPVNLAPGDKVPEPSSYTGNTVGSNVRLDRESYERSDAGVPYLPPVLSEQEEREAAGAGMFSVPTPGGTMIPESSLPMGTSNRATSEAPSDFVSSAAPQSTTAELAGQQPIRSRDIPEVVSNSQREAHFAPEASASPAAVDLKNELENEIQETVPLAPVTSESNTMGQNTPGQNTSGQNTTGQNTTGQVVPDVVSESQREAHAAPEASASPAAVEQKSELEQEIHDKVPEVPATSESGMFGASEKSTGTGITGMAAGGMAAAGAAIAGAAYTARDKATEATSSGPNSFLPASIQNAIDSMNAKASGTPLPASSTDQATSGYQSNAVPEMVVESQREAHVNPEASASPEAVREKSAMERELQREVSPVGGATTSASHGVPDMVVESQKEARFAPEASASPEAVREKSAVEQELQRTVSPVDEASTQTTGVPDIVSESQKKAHSGPEASASPEAVREKSAVEQELQRRVSPVNEASGQASAVPEMVAESQREARVGPEASASPEAVREKSAVEQELQRAVRPTNESGEPAPTDSAALSAAAPTKSTPGSSMTPQSTSYGVESGSAAGPISAAPIVDTTKSSSTSGISAPAYNSAQTAATKAAENLDVAPPPPMKDSRDVSPMTRTEAAPAPAPVVPMGDAAAAATTPKKNRPESAIFKDTPESSRTTGTNSSSVAASPADGKKNKRKSFFGKLKDKLKG